MLYPGSKRRLVKDLKPIIEKHLSTDRDYVEPFVGGANMIDKIDSSLVKEKIGADNNKYLIALLNKMKSDDIIPYEFIEKENWYKEILHPFRKGELIMDEWLVGYNGFTKTFSGMWMEGYAGIHPSQNFQLNKHKNIEKQRIEEDFKSIDFIHSNYKELFIENGSVVYIDPPYKGTMKYNKYSKDLEIDYEDLYSWIRDLVNIKDCIVFISEFNMPSDFKCIWEKEINSGILKAKDKKDAKKIEKLFIFEKNL